MPRSPPLEERIGLLEDDVDPENLSCASSTTLGEYAPETGGASHPKEVGVPGVEQTGGFRSWCRSKHGSFRRVVGRQPGRALFAVIKYLFLTLCVLFVGPPILFPSYTRPPPHYRDLESRCHGAFAVPGCANLFKEQVFISVSLYDADGKLARGQWSKNLLELIHLIGHKNVFLSIYENDSGPEGASALESLKMRLRCRYSIVNDPHVNMTDFPTLALPDDSVRVKRLAYMSEMRNRALRPLDRFDPDTGVTQYDKIMFMNDVSFRPLEAAHLLFSTNAGPDGRAHYLSACALDYHTPFLFYDLYATRDAEGFSAGLPIFPIFSNEGHGLSRVAMLAQSDAVPVSACWSGMVAMQAKFVQNLNEFLPNPHFQDIGNHVIDPSSPREVTPPVRFRYEPDLFFDACECCLFLADIAQIARKENAQELGVYVNPYVRVAYTDRVLAWLSWVKKWERLFIIPHAIGTPLISLPTHNPYRAVQEGDGFLEEIWIGKRRAGRWVLVPRVARNGLFCGVREFQTIRLDEHKNDINWENIKIPAGQILHYPT
ncbi:cryptococcal mannosyltransferase 1-domain-containing protein [Biscogniauxia marginata]|nr:cryptococcal mannosyltransferase 1-domain-containing protein [Biscogniauxia marginata]